MSANKLFKAQPLQSVALDVNRTSGIPVVGIVLICPDTDRVAIFQRNSNDSGAGDWEFPGGKVEAGETLIDALIREVQEEASIVLDPQKVFYVGNVIHSYPLKTIHLILFRHDFSSKFSNQFKLVDHQGFKWVDVGELTRINLSGADLAFLKRLHNADQAST